MAEDRGFVIVDENGVEHPFPAGTSPERAAQSLRLHREATRPLSEPTSFSEGFHKALKNEPVAGGLVGFAEGLPQGVAGSIGAIAHSPIDILNAMVSTAKGAERLSKDPVGTLSEAYESVKNMPGSTFESIRNGLAHFRDLAATDPEAFGKAVGNATGEVGTGLATMGASRVIPKPLARTVGQGLATVGKKAEWPLWITGAHQLAGGNPMGFVTLGMPSALKSTGTGLVHLGGGQTLAEVATAEKAAKTAAKAAKEEAKALSKTPMPSGARELDFGDLGPIRMQPPGVAATVDSATGIPITGSAPAPYRTSAKAAVKAEEEAATATRLRAEREAAGLKPQEPTFTTSEAAGGERKTTRYKNPNEKSAAAVDAEDKLVQQTMRANRGMSEAKAREAVRAATGQSEPLVTGGPERPTIRVTPPGKPIVRGRQSSPALKEVTDRVDRQIMEAEAAKGVPNNPVAQALEAERRSVEGVSPTGTERRVPTGTEQVFEGIPSRTSRGMSEVPGASANDLALMQESFPDVDLSTLSPDELGTLQNFLKYQRNQSYATEGILDKLMKSQFAREPE